MNTSFNQWMALQDEWSRRLDANARNILYRYLTAIPVFCIAAVVLLGMGAHRGAYPEAAAMLNRLKTGALLGTAMDLLCLLVLVPAMPGRRCRRQLGKMIFRLLDSEAEREAFAGQMLGRGGTAPLCLSWTDKSMDENRVWVTRDYILKISGTGRVQLVCLKEVEQAEADTCLHTWILGRKDLKLLCRRRTYRIRFRCTHAGRKTVRWLERLRGGPCITFPSKMLRDQVMEMMEAMAGKAAMAAMETMDSK